MRLDVASRNQALEPVTSGSSGRFGEFAVDAARSGDVLAYRADQGARQELRTYSLSSGLDHTLIADTDVARTIPRWSPDGKMVTYAVFNRSGARGSRAQAVAVLATDGGSERLLTMPGEHRFVPTDWSLGRTIIGSCRYGDPARWGTCTISTSDGPATRGMVRLLSADPSFNLYSQRFSPDQAWISFVGLASEDSARSTIFVSRPDGGDWRPITTGPWYVDKPRWASDSRALYYLSNRGGALNVWKQGFDPAAGALVGAPVEVTNFRDEQRAIPSRNFADIDIAVGGNRLFLPVTETSSAIWILSAVNSR
jgi:Tol biopolymer transport system component